MATANAPAVVLTAAEFACRPDPGYPEELVRGEIVRMPPPRPRHGEVCFRVAFLLGSFLERHPIGRVVTNDAGVITTRDPDTVRGADVAYYSHDRVPPGPLPERSYLDVAPDLVIEVLSPDDRWPLSLAKVAEYLGAGVRVVLLLDPAAHTVHVYRAEEPPRLLAGSETLTLPAELPGFAAEVSTFFA